MATHLTFYDGVCSFSTMIANFCTIIAYGVLMTTKVQDCQYDLGVNGQMPNIFKIWVMACNENCSYLLGGVFMFGTMTAYGV